MAHGTTDTTTGRIAGPRRTATAAAALAMLMFATGGQAAAKSSIMIMVTPTIVKSPAPRPARVQVPGGPVAKPRPVGQPGAGDNGD